MRRLNAFGTIFTLGLVVAACGAGGGRSLARGPGTSFLASVGFAARADWPSAVLHLGRDEMGGAGRGGFLLNELLDDLPELEVRRPEGEGWGIHRQDGAEGPWCELSVWVNGNRMARQHDNSPLTVDALVNVRWLDGIEAHLGSDGPVYEDPVCGAVLLWSERYSEPGDLPFVGWVRGRLTGESADTVTSVTLSPTGERSLVGLGGRFEFGPLLPGMYRATFTAGGEAVYFRTVRVYAFRDSSVDVEVGAIQPPAGR